MSKQQNQRKQAKGKKIQFKNIEELEQINLNAAGIDIGASEHWVSVPANRDEEHVRCFSCFTSNLYELADWLKECGITTVAMESTGVYWIPVYQILETRGFEVKLVNAHSIKTVPGRKSDVLDCQWIQQLHTYGLLSGSFRPEDQICVLRSYIRQRDNLIRSSSIHIQRMQKALSEMNLHLHQVLSDITGVTGIKIIQAIVTGERDPKVLATYRDRRVKSTQEDIEAALTGDYRLEQVFILSQELSLYQTYQAQIEKCDLEIERYLGEFEDKSQEKPPLEITRKSKKKSRNAPAFDLRSHLYRMTGIDFTSIDGLDVLTVQTIISEVGLDPKGFKSAKHFASWLGLCPGNNISGGKILSSKTRKVENRAAAAFRVASLSLMRSQSAIGAFFRRKKAQLGTPKAITATAHKLARLFYHLWSTGEIYQDPGADYYEQKHKQRMINNLKKTAQKLGCEIIVNPTVQEVS